MPHIAIISATFYEDIAVALKAAAESELQSKRYSYEHFTIPGCFEAPAALSIAAKSGEFDGYIILGCVIRGETSHYDYVCGESARGINELAIKKRLAVGYGIITAENREQAEVRADASQKNVGGRAAKACISMVKLKSALYGNKE